MSAEVIEGYQGKEYCMIKMKDGSTKEIVTTNRQVQFQSLCERIKKLVKGVFRYSPENSYGDHCPFSFGEKIFYFSPVYTVKNQRCNGLDEQATVKAVSGYKTFLESEISKNPYIKLKNCNEAFCILRYRETDVKVSVKAFNSEIVIPELKQHAKKAFCTGSEPTSFEIGVIASNQKLDDCKAILYTRDKVNGKYTIVSYSVPYEEIPDHQAVSIDLFSKTLEKAKEKLTPELDVNFDWCKSGNKIVFNSGGLYRVATVDQYQDNKAFASDNWYSTVCNIRGVRGMGTISIFLPVMSVCQRMKELLPHIQMIKDLLNGKCRVKRNGVTDDEEPDFDGEGDLV